MTCRELGIEAAQHRLVEKGTQQRAVAGAELVRAGQERIDDPEFRAGADPSGRDTVSRPHDSIIGAGGLESPHDGRADCEDSATAAARRPDRSGGRRRDRIRLVEWEETVEHRPTPGSAARRTCLEPEYFTCLEGRVEIVVAGQPHKLTAGDVLAFPGNTAHSYHNPDTRHPARGISVVILAKAGV
jgi:mannose-6-phosphate isomerase-like protein (cupin superfamily)